MAKNNSSSIVEFISDNFGVLFLITLFFVGGFMGGSLWKENQLLKNNQNQNQEVAAPTANQPTQDEGLNQDKLITIASEIGLDQAEFTKCLEEDRYQQKISEQARGGQAVGVGGTPGTIVVVNGEPKEFIGGALPDRVRASIESFMENPDQPAKASETFNPEGFIAVNEDDHLRGNPEANIVIVEYSDYECPFCTRFHTDMKEILADYEGEVAWVYRHFPLIQLHPNAIMVSNAAECAAEIGDNEAFWELSDILLAE